MELTTELKSAFWKIANLSMDCNDDEINGVEFEQKAFDILNEIKPLNATTEMISALESSLQMLEQTFTYRKANGLTFGNIFLEATISQVKDALSKATV